MKRIFDILLALMALLLFSPFGFIIVTILKFTGEGEIFYLQERVGRNGINFRLMKFATMLKNSPNIGTGEITLQDDPRVLPIGKFLRKTKLNEIPQVINIIKGDMSIVGPRPQTRSCFDYFDKKAQEELILVRPGLTGIGSIVFRDEERLINNAVSYDKIYKDIMKYKGELEIWYKKNQSFILDMKLIFLTAWTVFNSKSRLHEKILKGLPSRPDALPY